MRHSSALWLMSTGFVLKQGHSIASLKAKRKISGTTPCLRLEPLWWFNDSPEGMMRFREMVTETTGFYNTVGFNDDTRAFLSIPGRHDTARRMDCAYLAGLAVEHRLDEDEAFVVARDLAYDLVRRT